MKKTIILILAIFLLTACSQNPNVDLTSKDQSVKEAFENLNGQSNINGRTYMDVHIPEDNSFTPISEADALKLLESGTGVIIFEFPECPWCRNMMPVVNQAAKEVGLDTLYTFNILEHRNEIVLSEGELEVKNEGSEFYRKVLDLLGEEASVYGGLEDESIRRIYAPTVFVIVDGKVSSSHVSTVDSQEDPYVSLTEEQHQELLDIYKKMFEPLLPFCTQDKEC
jgi:thiol-disulfide isomerase/thioredoxin